MASSDGHHLLIAVLLLFTADMHRVHITTTASCVDVQIPGCHDVTKAKYTNAHSLKSAGKVKSKYITRLGESGQPNGLLLQTIWCYLLAPPCEPVSLPPCRQLCNHTLTSFVNDHGPSLTSAQVRRIARHIKCSDLPVDACDPHYQGETLKALNLPPLNKAINKKRFAVSTNRPNPYDCKCNNVSTKKVGRKRYMDKNYDFAIEATYLGTEGLPGGAPKVVLLKVHSVLKSTKVKIDLTSGGEMTLWAETGCVCPSLIKDEVYLFLGYEDGVNKRLLFDDKCMAVKWKKRWRDYIMKWEVRMEKHRNQIKMKRLKMRDRQQSTSPLLVRTGQRHSQSHRKSVKQEEKT